MSVLKVASFFYHYHLRFNQLVIVQVSRRNIIMECHFEQKSRIQLFSPFKNLFPPVEILFPPVENLFTAIGIIFSSPGNLFSSVRNSFSPFKHFFHGWQIYSHQSINYSLQSRIIIIFQEFFSLVQNLFPTAKVQVRALVGSNAGW